MAQTGEASRKRLVLILGGARSGKSTYAEGLAARLAGETGRVLYVATAQALDEEMARRIARHQRGRPPHWHTLEEPLDPGAAIARVWSSRERPPAPPAHAGQGTIPSTSVAEGSDAYDVVLLDCVTLWLSNLLLGLEYDDATPVPDEDAAAAMARAAVDRLLDAHAHGSANTILVSNEVGMGLVPPYPLGRVYRDLLGRVNAWLAAAADEVYLLVAGLPLRIKPDARLSPYPGAGNP